MLLGFALGLWLLTAIPIALLLGRYGYGSFARTPHVLAGATSLLGKILLFCPTIYMAVTLFAVVVSWQHLGWLWGLGCLLGASLVFSKAHRLAHARAYGEIYATFVSEKSHAIQAEDTLATIAAMHGIATEDIAVANRNLSEGALRPGMVLCIPGVNPKRAIELTLAVLDTRAFWPPGS